MRPLIVLALLAVPANVMAEDRPLADAISVARGDDCLRQDLLLQHVRMWLPNDRVDARLAVVVQDEEEGASFVLLRDGAAAAARRFDRLPVACVERRAAIGLAIAMALDAAVLDSLAGSRSSESARARGAPSIAIEVAIEAQLLVEVLPEVAAGWQVGPRLVIDDTVEIGAYAWVTSIAGADLGEGRLSAQLAAGRLDLCIRRRIDFVVLRGCAGGVAGAAFGEGHEVALARSSRVGFAGILGRFGLAIPLADFFALELAADGWLSLWRPRFDLVDAEGNAVVSSTLPLGGFLASAGASVRF